MRTRIGEVAFVVWAAILVLVAPFAPHIPEWINACLLAATGLAWIAMIAFGSPTEND